jgi:hypothetical protein
VHRNDSGIVEITIEDAWFQGNSFAGDASTPCTRAGTKSFLKVNLTNNPVGSRSHWCLQIIEATDSWELEPRNCTAVSGGQFTFSMTTGVVTCGFKRTANLTGTFNTSPTHAAVAELRMAGQPAFTTDAVAGHSIFCPETTLFTNLNVDLYTDTNSTPAAGAHPFPVNTTAPLYFS